MKTRTFISVLILFMAVLIIVGSCATGKKAVKAPIELLYGTWVNPDYNTANKQAKIIYKSDGYCSIYSHTDITIDQGPYKYTIPESWMDSDGKKYYKVDFFYATGREGIEYRLVRLNETDSVLEYVWSNIDYPTKIDPEHMNYRIYYRQ